MILGFGKRTLVQTCSEQMGVRWNACISMCLDWVLCECWLTLVFLILDAGNHPMVMLSNVVTVCHMYGMTISEGYRHNSK